MAKILLAESDGASSRELTKRLQARNHEVLAATDAINVLAVARQQQPDVILLSGALAGGGAVTAVKRLRSNVYTANLPVVGMAGRTGAKAREILEAGAQACLAHPLSDADLDGAIAANQLKELDFTEAPASVLADPARLATLAQSGLLDSPPETSFDRLTRLTSRLLGAPTALVSLVDRDRQFFKSQVGLAEPFASERQTRLSHSFCPWVVSDRDALVVGDATQHPVLAKNLAVRDMGVVAYAGVPLAGRDGQAIGSFCAIDSIPREWSDREMETLRDLGQVAEAYAVLEHGRRDASPDGLSISLRVAGAAVAGVARILRREGAGIDAADRDELLAVLEEQAGHLQRIAG